MSARLETSTGATSRVEFKFPLVDLKLPITRFCFIGGGGGGPPFNLQEGGGGVVAANLFISTRLGGPLNMFTYLYRTVLEVNYLFHADSARIY